MRCILNSLCIKYKILKIVCVSALIVLVIVGINKIPKQDSNRSLKIGVIAPLTGDFAGVGENIVKGIKTAQMVYKQQTGKNVDIVIENDSADAAKGLSAYKKLSEVDHVNGLINTFTSTMDSIYKPAMSADYPVMMEFFQANNVADDYVFQMTLGNDNVWDRYAKYINQAGYDETKVVVVHSVDAAQTSFSNTFLSAYKKPVTIIDASTDKNSLKSDALKIANLKPSMIIFFMTPENGAILTKDLLPLITSSTQLVYDIQLYTGISYYKDQLGGDLSKINGAINLMFEGDPKSQENIKFVKAYKELFPGEEPGFLADHGYDTFMVYMEAYNTDKGKWISNLQNTNVAGASGKISFDKNGIRIPDLVVKKVINGKSETVDRLP